MDDLEMTKLCAEAMGYSADEVQEGTLVFCSHWGRIYDPLHDDAQAMALVKELHLSIDAPSDHRGNTWFVHSKEEGFSMYSKNLNRAIVGCVALMQKEKTK